jgi:hypothetical protein
MQIDQVWWSEVNDIELALEHELQVRRAGKLVQQEVRHLIDIKALRKVMIAYLSEPDEKSLIDNTVNWLKTRRLNLTQEQYMIIIGRPTTKEGTRGLLYRRYLLYYNGSTLEPPEQRFLTQAKGVESSAAEWEKMKKAYPSVAAVEEQINAARRTGASESYIRQLEQLSMYWAKKKVMS